MAVAGGTLDEAAIARAMKELLLVGMGRGARGGVSGQQVLSVGSWSMEWGACGMSARAMKELLLLGGFASMSEGRWRGGSLGSGSRGGDGGVWLSS